MMSLQADDIWITDKIQGCPSAHDVPFIIKDSLKKMQIDKIDLLLIHLPECSKEQNVAMWEKMIEAQKTGEVGQIGVSNFNKKQVLELQEATGVLPFNAQME